MCNIYTYVSFSHVDEYEHEVLSVLFDDLCIYHVLLVGRNHYLNTMSMLSATPDINSYNFVY